MAIKLCLEGHHGKQANMNIQSLQFELLVTFQLNNF